MDKRPIGVFDSGVGGLTVIREIIKQLPNESIVYFGDTARVPYGNKSRETIVRYSAEITEFLLKKRVKSVVVACNTASALALNFLKKNYKLPILGVIDCASSKAVAFSKTGKIGVIGTESTIKSHAYQDSLKRLDASAKVTAVPCPLLAALVEEGWLNNEITRAVLKKYLTALLKSEVDTLILGCTHYPLLASTIRKIAGSRISIIDSASSVSQELKELLSKKNILAPNSKPSIKYFVSDSPERFIKIGRVFLGAEFSGVVKKITL